MINKADLNLYKLINNILENGYKDINPRPVYKDGTPAHTLSINHTVRSYDISKGEFPITTLRPIAWKSAIKEIIWIYQLESNNLEELNKMGVHYWNDWESKDIKGTIGARYGEVVRRYGLMKDLLYGLKKDPYGRRHIIDLYQYKELNETDGLNPCAFCTIWNVRNEKGKEYLDLALIQRSGDSLAASCSGVNEIQYTALLMMVARHCGYEAGILTHFVANEQLYTYHIDTAKELCKRCYPILTASSHNEPIKHPKLILNPNVTDFYEVTIDDFTMEDYEPITPNLHLELGI